jgi:hypothetical protein
MRWFDFLRRNLTLGLMHASARRPLDDFGCAGSSCGAQPSRRVSYPGRSVFGDALRVMPNAADEHRGSQVLKLSPK